jgi:hypothetical protein
MNSFSPSSTSESEEWYADTDKVFIVSLHVFLMDLPHDDFIESGYISVHAVITLYRL